MSFSPKMGGLEPRRLANDAKTFSKEDLEAFHDFEHGTKVKPGDPDPPGTVYRDIDEEFERSHPQRKAKDDAPLPTAPAPSSGSSMSMPVTSQPTASDKGSNGYVAHYKGKRTEVQANSSYEAQQIAAQQFGAARPYEVSVTLAEKDGEQVTHLPLMDEAEKLFGKDSIGADRATILPSAIEWAREKGTAAAQRGDPPTNPLRAGSALGKEWANAYEASKGQKSERPEHGYKDD